MRLLHTSDWHLGRSFHGASLLQEQAAALSRMGGLDMSKPATRIGALMKKLRGS